jgi:hypothetical protein
MSSRCRDDAHLTGISFKRPGRNAWPFCLYCAHIRVCEFSPAGSVHAMELVKLSRIGNNARHAALD